jgi:hypothetical protein
MGYFAHSSASIIIDNAYGDSRFDSQHDRAVPAKLASWSATLQSASPRETSLSYLWSLDILAKASGCSSSSAVMEFELAELNN